MPTASSEVDGGGRNRSEKLAGAEEGNEGRGRFEAAPVDSFHKDEEHDGADPMVVSTPPGKAPVAGGEQRS